MADINSLSDEELQKIATRATGATPSNVSQVSDEELQAIASGVPMEVPATTQAANAAGAAGRIAGGLLTGAGRAVSSALEGVESVTGAPSRAAVSEFLRDEPEFGKPPLEQEPGMAGKIAGEVVAGGTPLGILGQAVVPDFKQRVGRAAEAFGRQFGEDPKLAPTGAEIAEERLGIPGEKTIPSDVIAQSFFASNPIFGAAVKAALPERVSPADVVGVPAEMAIDFSNLVPLGALGGKFVQGVSRGLKNVIPGSLKLKRGSEGIEQATKAIGAKLTPGQVIDSRFVQDMESSLSQTPTVGGLSLRRKIGKNLEAAQETAESIINDATTLTNVESAKRASSQIRDQLENAIRPAEAIYQRYDDLFKSSRIKPQLGKVNEAIDGLLQKSTTSREVRAILEGFKRNELPLVNNLDGVKNLRSDVGQVIRDTLDGNVKRQLGQIYGALTEVRSDTLKAAAQKVADDDIAKGALEAITQADQIYRNAAEDLGSTIFRHGKKMKGGLRSALDSYLNKPELKVVKDIFDTGDPDKLANIRRVFPDAFDTLRRQKIAQMAEKAGLRAGKDINPRSIAKAINNLEPETARLIFGTQSVRKAKALETFYNSLPAKVGASGTPSGSRIFDLFTPQGIFDQISALGRSATLNLANKMARGTDPVQAFIDAGLIVAGTGALARPFREDQARRPDFSGLSLPNEQLGLSVPQTAGQ